MAAVAARKIEETFGSDRYLNAMERLIGVVQALSFARDVDAVAGIVRDAARDLTGADGATFVLRDGDKCYYADENAISPLWKGQRFPMSACISGWVMLNGEPAIIPDIYADPRIPVDAYRPTFVRSLVMVPIRRASPIGAIGNYWSGLRHPAAEEVALLQSLADTTSVALENAQLYGGLQSKIRDILSLNRKLAQQNEELERFAYICSHDMHEPVRMMSTYSVLLQQEYAGTIPEKGGKYISFIARSSGRLQNMIEQIIAFCRVGREEVQLEEVDCNQVAEEVLAEFGEIIQSSQAQIICRPLPTIRTSLALVQMLLHNLIDNALKFQPPGRKPVVVIDAARSLLGERPAWQINIRDNGIGIDPESRDRVFTIFQRIHRKEDYPGAAIGLSICKKFVELCGGAMDYQSVPGEGTTFYVLLPETAELHETQATHPAH
jgi:signal transduction histidine kinase